jgi:sugar lactone lactonase YvrE
VSNEKYSETNSNARAGLGLPRHAGSEDKDQTADLPIFTKVQIVPETADIPVPEEFRIKWRSAWPEALSAVMTIGLMVIIAFVVGCGTGGVNMTATMTSTPTLDKALWVANGTNVVEFIPSQLTAGNSDPVPHLSLNSSVFGAPQGVTFDAMGDLWVIDGGTVSTGGNVPPSLFEFTADQLSVLSTTANPEPSITITSKSFTFPQQAVFDPNGNLWVSDNGSNAIFVLTPQQLVASSNQLSPAISIASNPAFQGPLGIVFDTLGNLYIANNASTTIFKFDNNILPRTAGSYTLTPSITLSDDGHGSIQGPWALVFDTKGDLWSSNANAPNTIVEFMPSQLGSTSSPTPAVTLSSVAIGNNQTLAAPNGIAFDNLGDLAAISSATPFGVAGFQKAQLMPTGSGPAPNPFLVGTATTLNAPAGCNFGPVVQ